MPSRDIIVVGASFGGLSVLKQLCSQLPHSLPAAVFVVWHISPASPGLVPDLLRATGARLPVALAKNAEVIQPGRIYVAPPDRHMLLTPTIVRLTDGPRENCVRPAIDPLFRSAAQSFGPRVIGIVLTGLLDDGTQGLWFIKRQGGVTIVQDPREAEAPSMPDSAIAEGVVDYIVPLSALPDLISELCGAPVPSKTHQQEGAMQTRNQRDDTSLDDLLPSVEHGPQAPLACPNCGGALWIASDPAQPMRYHCHVGHQFSEHNLAEAKRDELDLALWTALRVLRESAALYGTMAARARAKGHGGQAAQHEWTSRDHHEKARIIRRALGVGEGDPEGPTV